MPPDKQSPRDSGVGAAGVIMALVLFCAILAPIGWVPSRLSYALRVGQAARLQPHPIDDDLISTLAKERASEVAQGGKPSSPYAFFVSQAASGAGSAPPGLDVDTATGALIGTPTIAGTYTVAVGIAGGRSARLPGPAFTVRVLPPS